MSNFKRKFENFELNKFQNEKIYKFLQEDIHSGEVFPALRENRIDFYYKGGRIFEYVQNRFSYNKDYHKYMGKHYELTSTDYLTDRSVSLEAFYQDLKKGVSQRHSKETKPDEPKERQFLSLLYKSTFTDKSNNTVVLDIEIYNGKKCDLVLYNNQLQKLMLIEAKVAGNPDLVSKTTPNVIAQVNEYSNWLTQAEVFMEQYSHYIEFINKTFGTSFNREVKDICKTAKLIVFEQEEEINKEEHKQKLREGLGIQNVLFTKATNDIDQIWESLDK